MQLLCADGSHGLDLSFVTRILLLERLKDKALQEQIISRANRMGATGTVSVPFALNSIMSTIGPVLVTTVLARAREDETEDGDG